MKGTDRQPAAKSPSLDASNPVPHQWGGGRPEAHSPSASIDHLSSPAARGSSSPIVL